MPRLQRPGPSSVPAVSSHTTAKAKNNPSTYRAFHTLPSSANRGARMRNSVGTCQFSFMSPVTTSKAAWPKACPLFAGSFKLQNGVFSWTLPKTLRWFTRPPVSSLGPIQWLLWGQYSQGAGNIIQYGRTIYPPIHSGEKLKDFILKIKANTFRSNFNGPSRKRS